MKASALVLKFVMTLMLAEVMFSVVLVMTFFCVSILAMYILLRAEVSCLDTSNALSFEEHVRLS